MNTYEIILACLCCNCHKERSLGFVQADSAYDAKREAERRWPDARYEEIVARIASERQSGAFAVCHSEDARECA